MKEKSRIIILVLIMTALVSAVSWTTFYHLYRAAIQQEEGWLTHVVQSQARLIEAVARFDAKYSAEEKDYPEGSFSATLSQIEAAHKNFVGFGKTGEFTLGKLEGDNIVFLLSHRHSELGKHHSVPFDPGLAEPMRLALSGKSGSGILLDYRGATVLAAYEPVAVLNIGIVAKMDLDEIRAPFIRAGLISAAVAILLITLGSASFFYVTNPLLNHLKKSEEQIRLLLNSTGEAIYGLDLQGNCTFANPACLRMLGAEEGSSVIGKNMHDLIHPPREDSAPCKRETCGIHHVFPHGKETHAEDEFFRRFDGTIFPAEYWSRPIYKDGEIIGTVVTFVDITKRRRAEEELKKAKEAAENATKLKDKFVFLVAHNLRGPFVPILGFLELILKDEKDPVSENHAAKLRNVGNSCRKLLKVIEDLLDMSRIHGGVIRPAFQFIDAHAVVAEASDTHAHMAQEKGVALVNRVPKGTRIYADSRLLGDVINNLLSNAIKFSGSGGEITIYLPSDRKAAIAVKDTGTGIQKEMVPDLFKEEVKTTGVGTWGEKGTGLGLPYSMEIMKAQGGTLDVETEEGKGSIFYAQLPDIKPRVLIMDDEELVRLGITVCLKQFDLVILEAENGESGLELLRQKKPHLIITDVFMPGMGGFEFLKCVKQDPDAREIPVIVITGDREIKTRDTAFQLGARDFISKPLTMEDVIPRVRRYIG